MKKLSLILFSTLILFKTSLISTEIKFIQGQVEVIDGDTIVINNIKVRLFGIDAPEKNQICTTALNSHNCGKESTDALKKLIGKKKVYCRYESLDIYKRILGICSGGGGYYWSTSETKNKKQYEWENYSINALMVKYGHAVAYTRYSKRYLKWEEYAKNKELGIWKYQFDRPEDWRKKNK